MSGLCRYLHAWAPQNTPSKMYARWKENPAGQNYPICFIKQTRGSYPPFFFQVRLGGGMPLDSQIRLTKLPSVTVSWELPSEPEILGDTAKKKPNKCSLWNNTLSASSKLQMTLMQISPFSSEAITRTVSSMLTRPWVGNNTLGNDCIHPSGLGGLLHAQALFWAAFEWTSLHKAGLRNFVNWLQL